MNSINQQQQQQRNDQHQQTIQSDQSMLYIQQENVILPRNDEDHDENEYKNFVLAALENEDQQENLVSAAPDDDRFWEYLKDYGCRLNSRLRFSFLPREETALLYMDGEFVRKVKLKEVIRFMEELGIDDINNMQEEFILATLKTRKFQLSENQDGDQEHEICVVCQSEYEDDEILGTLQCGHEYHSYCIKIWLLEKNCCPICKRMAVKEEC